MGQGAPAVALGPVAGLVAGEVASILDAAGELEEEGHSYLSRTVTKCKVQILFNRTIHWNRLRVCSNKPSRISSYTLFNFLCLDTRTDGFFDQNFNLSKKIENLNMTCNNRIPLSSLLFSKRLVSI